MHHGYNQIRIVYDLKQAMAIQEQGSNLVLHPRSSAHLLVSNRDASSVQCGTFNGPEGNSEHGSLTGTVTPMTKSR
jgi:hypothetical protein